MDAMGASSPAALPRTIGDVPDNVLSLYRLLAIGRRRRGVVADRALE